jgi:DNA polymerase-3 subunit gamma/tau
VRYGKRAEAPRDLAAQLTALLAEATGARWTIALSNAPGEPTLAEQGKAAEAERLTLAQSHPLVQAVLAAFPGAAIAAVRDEGADAYGLPVIASTEPEPDTLPEDMPEFAPPDAEPVALDDL